jgi:hypothetical protein
MKLLCILVREYTKIKTCSSLKTFNMKSGPPPSKIEIQKGVYHVSNLEPRHPPFWYHEADPLLLCTPGTRRACEGMSI